MIPFIGDVTTNDTTGVDFDTSDDDVESCKEEPEEERERYFGIIRLPPARRILRKRRPAQRQSEYG